MCRSRLTCWVHPRSRGATMSGLSARRLLQGPSPLTRGNPVALRVEVRRAGSIPAHAGQPPRPIFRSSTIRVHPRSRGATPSWVRLSSAIKGPSPLTRGNHWLGAPRAFTGGSIPAHAGQPRPKLRSYGSKWVHPRSRGATKKWAVAQGFVEGPSPLTRGNHTDGSHTAFVPGSIPAHAGQPSSTVP